jgi:hypothetical protein
MLLSLHQAVNVSGTGRVLVVLLIVECVAAVSSSLETVEDTLPHMSLASESAMTLPLLLLSVSVRWHATLPRWKRNHGRTSEEGPKLECP